MALFLITGPPGAGKTATSAALMERFDYGLHVSVDALRMMVVSGMSHPVPKWTAETTLQFNLARGTAASMAARYLDMRFEVAVDDVLLEGVVQDTFMPVLGGRDVRRIMLLPSVEEALRRNEGRRSDMFDPDALVDEIRGLHPLLKAENTRAAGWQIIDSTRMSVRQVVDAILATRPSRTSRGSAAGPRPCP